MSSQVVLYDIPSQQGTAWSLNPWKTRMILNFKGIDYKTGWIEYPDIKATLQSFGIAPNDPNGPGFFGEYTSPAIKYANGQYEMDSWPIAHKLEQLYPSPSLHLDNPIVVQIRDHVAKLVGPLRPHIIPKVPLILNERSQVYFYETREKAFGKPLPEVAKDASESGWESAKVAAKEAGDLLRQHSGPFFLGETVSYADFIFVSMLHFVKRVDPASYERLMGLDEAFPRLYEASKQWLQKED